MDKKTILITGGAGFIGANFVHYMSKNHTDYNLIVFDKLTYAGNLENLEAVADKITFIKGDIANFKNVNSAFEKHRPDIVVNFAAESHVDRSINNPELFLQTNVLGTQILMDASLKFNVERFHQISTDEVYGDLPLERDDLSFNEESPLCPSSPYSASKASADLLAMAYYRTFELPVTVSRCSNNYGAYQFPEKLIPVIITRALEDKSIPVFGNGANVRDWIYVDDHCSAVDTIIHNGTPGNIYNIGAMCEKTNIDIVKHILKALKKPDSLIEYVPDRKGHDLRYALNSSKIFNELGWRAQTEFEVGMSKTVDWYLKNSKWWKKLL